MLAVKVRKVINLPHSSKDYVLFNYALRFMEESLLYWEYTCWNLWSSIYLLNIRDVNSYRYAKFTVTPMWTHIWKKKKKHKYQIFTDIKRAKIVDVNEIIRSMWYHYANCISKHTSTKFVSIQRYESLHTYTSDFKECICGFRMIIMIKSDYIPKRNDTFLLRNGGAKCCLWNRI